jgi:hypothetical protein
MIHPLLSLLATRPLLLAAHVEAYAALAAAELGEARAGWQRQALLNTVALCSLVLSAGLAGVALMLWGLLPEAAARMPWPLLGVPLAPLALALGCLQAGRSPAKKTAFGKLRQQLDADLRMLREAGGS